MKNIFVKFKENWLVIFLVIFIIVLLTRKFPVVRQTSVEMTTLGQRDGIFNARFGNATESKLVGVGMMPPVFQEPAPVQGDNRLMVRNTNLSMKVGEVRKAIDGVTAETVRLGGFLVDSNLNITEGAATGQISIRIPTEKLSDALTTIRALSVKVVSENITGSDVTAEYVDLTARLETLAKTKARFDQILDNAVEIGDILNIQREVLGLQAQIDAVRGQQKYLEQTAKLSLVTVFLSTDELALPYAPDDAWRPTVVFREAVRSLIRAVRGLGTVLIWVVVYIPVWAPVMLLVWWIKRRLG